MGKKDIITGNLKLEDLEVTSLEANQEAMRDIHTQSQNKQQKIKFKVY